MVFSPVRLAAVVLSLVVAGSAVAETVPVPPRHVIYLHGRIVQDQQSRRPEHPEYGHYEFDKIVEALQAEGFTVTAEMRPRYTSVNEGAEHVVRQVDTLLRARVPQERIVVLGASMGAAIALLAAARLQDSEIRFALLGPCIAANIPAVEKEEVVKVRGRMLVVREESDVASSECPKWDPATMGNSGLTARELVINTGQKHGFLYRPMPEWLKPVSEWIKEK